MERFGSLAYLSDDALPVLDSLLASATLSESQRDVLGRARRLFSLLAGADAIVLGTTVGRMSGDDVLDSVCVIPVPTAAAQLAEYSAEYRAVLEAVEALQERLTWP